MFRTVACSEERWFLAHAPEARASCDPPDTIGCLLHPAAAPPDFGEAPRGCERVVLVDDDPMVLDSAALNLRALGYEVRAYAAPAEALASIEAGPEGVDLLLTDSSMPGMSGEALIARVRAIRPDLPVILWSGSSESDPAERARRLGIEACATKPLPIVDLARLLRDVLDRRAGERRRAA